MRTVVGYAGGQTEWPTYKTVCGNDGHTEAIMIEFDPSKITYEDILRMFFREHDPMRAKHKVQYKSAIWVQSDAQRETAERLIAALGPGVATEVHEAAPFWDAEEYHQDYLEKSLAKRGRGW